MLKLKSDKDFYAGLLYVLLAAGFLWFGREYRFGAASRMGPGYFPITLGWLLLIFGGASLVRAFVRHGEPIGAITWRTLALVTASVVLFGATIMPLGLIFALPAMVAMSASASRESRYDFSALLVLLGLTIFCIVVFVKGLGVPMPIFGSLFDGLVPPSWQR